MEPDMTQTEKELADAYLDSLPEEDREGLLKALLQWRAEGNPNPLIPADHDVDGDGTADAFGLNAFGQLTVYFGVKLSETVTESDGGGVEAPVVPKEDEIVDISYEQTTEAQLVPEDATS
ncbi:hypothetical protein PBI_DEWDROP_82 [Microbacterium phage Dewdrop]|nr:hypothetical protein PBI_LEAF_82 [Microbacterium phage Leaf]QGZ17450.1 hypothetical protein PBI_DEWDROP_82 [Microbacterium phage Dewdrop]